MNRRVIVALAALAASAAVPAAATAGGTAPRHDFVAGAGQNNPANGKINHFAINAISDPSGQNPRGDGLFADTLNAPPLRLFAGPVVCLRVDGSKASVVFRITHALNQSPRWDGGGDVMFIQDRGDPHGDWSPDRMINHRLTASGVEAYETSGCPEPMSLPRDRHLLSGNIVVHDAKPRH